MATAARIVDARRDPRWRAMVEGADGASPFHHPAWLDLLNRTYGYEITGWAVESGDALVAGLPVARVKSWLTGRRLVSLPFSDLCEPLVAPGAPSAALDHLAALAREQHARAGLDVELRCRLPRLEDAAAGERFWHHVIHLERDVAAVEARFSKSQVRRGIAKARRCGVTIRRATDVAALDAFYRLHARTRRRQGVPTQPRRFIRGFARLFDEGLGHVLLAECDGDVIAAAVFLRAGTTVLYKYGASAREHLDKRPNNLLFSEAIRMGCEEGAVALDMGRTDLDNPGLRAFKLAWGAEEREIAYTRLSAKPVTAGGGVPATARRMITSSPPLFGRLVGEALYRHYG